MARPRQPCDRSGADGPQEHVAKILKVARRRYGLRANLALGRPRETAADERPDAPAGSAPPGRGSLRAGSRGRRGGPAPRSAKRRRTPAGGLAPYGPARDPAGPLLARASPGTRAVPAARTT